jgi:hypothetical protein
MEVECNLFVFGILLCYRKLFKFSLFWEGEAKDSKEILHIMTENECKAAACSNNKRSKCKKVVINGILRDNCDK